MELAILLKMLHNGIEYAEMQIITEAYHILKRANYTNIEISEFFKEFSTQNRSSYLIEITSEILLKKTIQVIYLIKYNLMQIIKEQAN